MKYVSFAERQGIEKGIEKGEKRRARKSLETVMEAKFGPEGKALVQRPDESTDLDRLDALTRAAALALSLDDVRRDFEAPSGNGQADAGEKAE
jgi:hypothetical protein